MSTLIGVVNSQVVTLDFSKTIFFRKDATRYLLFGLTSFVAAPIDLLTIFQQTGDHFGNGVNVFIWRKKGQTIAPVIF
jgi:hypothetical protein